MDNFLWHVEPYFETLNLEDERLKIKTATLYLTDYLADIWWRRSLIPL